MYTCSRRSSFASLPCVCVSRKELERLANEREQLVSQALPEHLKMVAVATGGPVSLGDVIRLQGECSTS